MSARADAVSSLDMSVGFTATWRATPSDLLVAATAHQPRQPRLPVRARGGSHSQRRGSPVGLQRFCEPVLIVRRPQDEAEARRRQRAEVFLARSVGRGLAPSALTRAAAAGPCQCSVLMHIGASAAPGRPSGTLSRSARTCHGRPSPRSTRLHSPTWTTQRRFARSSEWWRPPRSCESVSKAELRILMRATPIRTQDQCIKLRFETSI